MSDFREVLHREFDRLETVMRLTACKTEPDGREALGEVISRRAEKLRALGPVLLTAPVCRVTRDKA